MWISNTATTAMMVPIVEAVIDELFKVFKLELNIQSNIQKNYSIRTRSSLRMGPQIQHQTCLTRIPDPMIRWLSHLAVRV